MGAAAKPRPLSPAMGDPQPAKVPAHIPALLVYFFCIGGKGRVVFVAGSRCVGRLAEELQKSCAPDPNKIVRRELGVLSASLAEHLQSCLLPSTCAHTHVMCCSGSWKVPGCRPARVCATLIPVAFSRPKTLPLPPSLRPSTPPPPIGYDPALYMQESAWLRVQRVCKGGAFRLAAWAYKEMHRVRVESQPIVPCRSLSGIGILIVGYRPHIHE